MLDLPLPEHSLGGVLFFLATVCFIYELDKFDSDKLAFVLYQILARHIFLNLHPHVMTEDTFFEKSCHTCDEQFAYHKSGYVLPHTWHKIS